MKDFAHCDDDNETIYLRSGIKGVVADQTLLHELIHGILYRSGGKFQLDDKQEEALVRALEHGLWQAGYRLAPSEVDSEK
jgi:predicted SprT family Zn-dependent metalloprotease